jgi:uncharacterized membrane protein YidH (DUF202 family)
VTPPNQNSEAEIGEPTLTGECVPPMIPIGRLLIIVGVVLIILGIILSYSSFFSFLKLGRLPGDIAIKRENFSFYLPITTCIVLSLVLTLIVYLFRK